MKSKHQGGGAGSGQGFAPRTYAQYQAQADNGRQYQREPPYHIPGGPGAGQGMRPMHHQHPQQPPTPPQPQPQQLDPKAPPVHMQAMMQGQHQQQHQPQPGGQMMYPGHMTIQGRPAAPQQMYNRNNAPVSNRPPTPRMILQGPQFLPTNQQVPYAQQVGMSQQFMMQSYMPGAPNRYYVPNTQYPNQYSAGLLYTLPVRQAHLMPQQAQPGAVAGNMMVPPVEQPIASKPQKKRRSNALTIIDPSDGHNVLEAYFKEENTPPGSGESSARETPQLVDNKVTAEFARKVASTLGDDAVRPGSRSSSYSESEPQINQDHNAAREGIASPKIEPEVVMMGEPAMPMVENNVGYPGGIPEGVVPAVAGVPGWMPHMVPPPPLVMLHHQEDVMRPPPHRDFQSWPPQEPPMVAPHQVAMPPMPLPTVVPNTAPPTLPQQPTLLKKPEQATPVVSALSGPEMDNINREYPSLNQQRHATHQSPGRSKRPQRPLRQEPEVAPAPVLVQAPQPTIPVSMSVPPPASETPKVPSPVPVEAPAPVEQVVQAPVKVAEPSQPAPQPIRIEQPPAHQQEAKSHHKNKSNKRQQRQEQQRLATPPPPRAVTPTADAPTLPPKQVQATQMAPQRVASPARAKEPSPSPPPVVPPTPVAAPAPREPTPPPVTVTPVVDKQTVKQNDVNDEQREERLVAAMNEENDKMTASVKRAETAVPTSKPAPTPAPVQVKEPEPAQPEPEVVENNNVAKISMQVESSEEPTPIIENAKPALKFIYKKEQWSPENPTGKKQYDRDFIMQLMHEPFSKKRPDNLPALEVLRDAARRDNIPRGGSMHNNHNIPMPGFMKPSSSLRGSGPGPRDSNHMKRPSMGMGNKGGGGKPSMGKPAPISISLTEDVKLRECETPWKPSRNNNQTDLTEEEIKTEALYKRVRGVLNRLTPQKFHKLVAQVRALPIDTPERLEGVINLVFEKAVDEPGFSSSYAEMCRELGKLTVKDGNKDKNENEKKPNYRILLVQRCQKEFEKNNYAELNRDERLKEIEAEAVPEKKKELQLLLDEDERKIRVKSVGNIRFIGELYKLQQLTSFIMFSCIDHLIKLNSEESLECLCKLLTTIGGNLESDYHRTRENYIQKIAELKSSKEKESKEELVKTQQSLNSMQDFNRYFNELDTISRGRGKSSRVRFMIRDLIDLREAKWKPKRDEGPKTMDQIAKEAEREQFETNLAISAANLDNKRGGGGGGGRHDSRNSMDNRGGGGRRGQESNGGWTQVSTNARKQYVETSKLRVTNVEMDLGMSLGSRDTFIWNKGSANKSEERKPPVTVNKFAALLDEKPLSRSSSLKGTLPSGPGDTRDARPLRPSPPDERSSRSSTPSLRPDAAPVSREAPAEVNRASAPASSTSDPEQFERSVHSLVDEFIHNTFYEEAVKTLVEKVDEGSKSDMVLHVFLHALEKATKFRRGCGRLLAHFLQTASITPAHFFAGLKNFLADSDDLVVDIPKLWEYLAELLADVVSGGMGLAPVLEALRPPTSGTARTIATILRIVAPLPGVASCIPPLVSYLGGPPAYQTFAATHQLEGLDKPQPKPINDSEVTAELTRLLRANADFDAITKWIDFNVGPACIDVAFTRVLVNSLLDVCLTPNASSGHKLDQDIFKRHVKLLIRYIDFNEERELHCLFTIQAKMSALDHPQGVLSELCNQLLEGFAESYVISSDSFKKWRDNKDPQYMVGQGVCIKSLHTFFTVMDAGDDNDDIEETS